MITNHLPGDDITIMNTIYTHQRKNEDQKWEDETLTVIYKDNVTGKKSHQFIPRPEYTFYKIKEDKVKDFPQLFVPKEDCEEISVRGRNIEKEIAEITNNKEFYETNIKNGSRYLNKQLHALPDVSFSDVNIEDHYRFRFSNLYKNDIRKLYKGYFDIEVDGKYMLGDFPTAQDSPVNCVSYLDEKTNKVYVFILRNKENPLIEEFERSINNNLFKEVSDFVTEKVGGWKQAKRFGVDTLGFEFLFYDSEISLIKGLFDTFNDIDPDFVLAWNMGFDIPFIIDRIYELGYLPEDIMCNSTFEKKIAEYYVDERNKNEYAERGDYANISSNIVYIDQMIQFASRRKSKVMSFPNFKLDTIGELIAKVKKLDYSHITSSVVQLPYLDFKTFVFYNIMDVIVQKCIETKTQDMEYIFAKCIVNNTSYKKGHRQTVYLINRMAKEFYDEGFIIGNNVNRWNEKPLTKFSGALVGDPKNTNDYAKLHINGRPISVADNLLDEDYKSLYPHIDIEHNMAPNTMIGAIVIDDVVYGGENAYNSDKFVRSGEYIENLVSGNVLEFSKRWLGLAGFSEFIFEDIPEYLNAGNTMRKPMKMVGYGVHFSTPKETIEPIHFDYNPNPLYFEPKPLDYNNILNELRRING